MHRPIKNIFKALLVVKITYQLLIFLKVIQLSKVQYLFFNREGFEKDLRLDLHQINQDHIIRFTTS